MSASLCSVAPKIWLALPTSAVPFMVPRVSVKVPETPMPTGLGPPNSGLSSSRGRGVALHQHLALEGVALHGVAAGIEQIGVAAEDLAIAEQNHAAALADAPIQQGDVDRIQPVLHDVPDAGRRAHGSRSRSYAKARPAASTRQVAREFPSQAANSRACHSRT